MGQGVRGAKRIVIIERAVWRVEERQSSSSLVQSKAEDFLDMFSRAAIEAARVARSVPLVRGGSEE